MIFYISLAFTHLLESRSIGIGGTLSDDSIAQTKHWKLVIASSKRARVIELTTRDRETILISLSNIEPRHLYNDLPMYNKFHVARYNGHEDDFDRVLRHHPMRGGKYSETFNNCQHFVVHFLVLLKALADGDPTKSFEGNERWEQLVRSNNVLSTDGTFLWNSPNLYYRMVRLGYPIVLLPAVVVADAAAGATATAMIPATGIMGWLGAAPTATIVAAPYAAAATVAATTMSVGMVAGAGVGAFVYKRKQRAWKEETKVNHPLLSGFPTGSRPMLSNSELF